MKTITLFLLIFSAWALTAPRIDLDTLEITAYNDNNQPITYSFNNLNDDDVYYGGEEINEEENAQSLAEWPEEENLVKSKVPKVYDDLDETELLSVLSQILNDSSFHKEITDYLEKFSNKKHIVPLKSKEGYIDLFDLLIFGSLKSKRLYSAEEESNEEGILHTMAHANDEWTMVEEENFEDDDLDDQAFIDLLMSNKELNGEFIIDMVLSLMNKYGNNDVDDDEEEEALEQDISVVVLSTEDLAAENADQNEASQRMRPSEKKEEGELDQVFGLAIDF